MVIPVKDLLLADGMSVGVVLFLIVSFVSWIFNLIKGNQNGAKPVQFEKRPPRPGSRPAQPRRGQRRRVRRAQNDFDEVELEDEVEWDEESQPTLRRRTTPSEPQVSRGASVAEHVEQHMHNSSIADHVEEYLDHGVDKSVEEHLGFRTTKSSKTGDRSSSVHQFVETLRDPDSVRKAIIINEVLMPPKALRVRR